MSKIPLTPSSGVIKDLASSFEAGLFPLSSIEEFKAIYDQFKKDHPKADHYPYAYSLNGVVKSSDDGEPGGTAGRPMGSLLTEAGVDGLLIVARYFGGSKLGVPRLRRAFVDACEEAMKNASYGAYQDVYVYSVEVDYPAYETLNNGAKRFGYTIRRATFDLKVRVELCSSGTLDGLNESLGLYDLDLGPASIEKTLVEV